ncbi:hypothetical protein QRD43_13185 [Pelomonas sp. APW6]|uniref:Glycosylase n=1 Tax=Roseateles subflavus TaxID=3053353 RepID=A0ABT7LKS3_9BURK|nr:hypothetical protein [Pelomonas sp. APW6]MDL5032862.1 hypothetical protein [Pelomonas sp. APW6]
MFEWIKHGKIFDPRDYPGRWWLHEFAQAPATLILPDVVRVYFSCRPAPDPQGSYVSHTAFVDLDRHDLRKIVRLADEPILPLGTRGTFDEFGVYPVSVIAREDRLYAYYGGWTRCESIPFTVSVGIAQSLDGGVTFERLGPGPLITSDVHEPFVISGPKIRHFNGQWHLWYVAGTKWHRIDGRVEAVYKIRHAVSDDGLAWQRDHRDLLPDVLEADECQASPDVIEWGGRYHMFFCFKHSVNFRDNARGYRIGYAWSEDLVHWHRDDSMAGLNFSEEGWDSESAGYPHVFELDGQLHMLYIGNQFGRHGFGLATARSPSP